MHWALVDCSHNASIKTDGLVIKLNISRLLNPSWWTLNLYLITVVQLSQGHQRYNDSVETEHCGACKYFYIWRKPQLLHANWTFHLLEIKLTQFQYKDNDKLFPFQHIYENNLSRSKCLAKITMLLQIFSFLTYI